MLLTNRLVRLVAITVVATVAVAALITFAFTSDAISGGSSRTEAETARPSVSVAPPSSADVPGALTAEAVPSARPEPSEDAATEVEALTSAGSTPTSTGGDRPQTAPASPSPAAPTAAPTTPAPTTPAPAPTTPPPPRQCYLLIIPVACP